MQPTPEYVEAEKRRKANRDRALLNLPKLVRPVDIPSYSGVQRIQALVAFCSFGCWFAALLCFFRVSFFFAAGLIALGYGASPWYTSSHCSWTLPATPA